MARQIVALGAVVAVVVAGLLLSAMGRLGPGLACGADRVPGCQAWPAPLTFVIWAVFIGGVAGLLIWQLRYLDR